MDPKIVKKNSYDFSAVKEVLNEVNNNEFKSGASDFYSIDEGYLDSDTSKSYIWTAISAVADDVMETIYQNVLNYIGNVSDIDTCSVKALQSMVQILGTKFSVFDNLANSPVEILNLIDIFSMRKDYLLNSEKVCQQMVTELSTTGGSGILNSTGKYIDSAKLDNVISATFYNVLTAHVNRKYGSSSSGNDFIYKELSDSILNHGFQLPNNYYDLIEQNKTKWNLTAKFDQELEADNIDNGLSVLDDYTEREQNILSMEFLRRSAAKSKLESRTRYAYYKELDVKNYFKFIEETYNNLSNIYIDSDRYNIDKNFIEISSLTSAAKLLDSNANLNMKMIEIVVQRLVDITTQIRDIREYLKSHAQRNYMKGTFLLISYVVNEYLKNNVYPILPNLGYNSNIKFNSDRNSLELVEYIDQTQYNNIFTDIDEDKNDKSLNAEYWNGSGANGSFIGLDSTNIFKPADKLKVVTSKTFSTKEIEDFYLEVLNNETGIRRQKDKTPLYDFLTTLFKVGADNTYVNSNGKVMCELTHDIQTSSATDWYAARRFTKDIDNYIDSLSSAFNTSKYLLDGYEPLPNTSYQEQIDEIKVRYDGKAYQAYSEILQNKMSQLQSIIGDYDTVLEQIDMLNVQFIELTSRFLNLVVSQSPNTGDFQMTGSVFANNLARYSSFINSQSFTQKWTVQQQIDSIQSQYNILFEQALTLAKTQKIVTSINYSSPIYNDYELAVDFPVTTGTPIILSSYYVNQHHEDLGQFESIYNGLYLDLNSLRTTMQSDLLAVQSTFQTSIANHKAFAKYLELNNLSIALSNFINDQASIFDCINDISTKLDYTNTEWYKYKTKLFNKYTGLSTSDIPFYYIENSKHPSYQIHPCLSNFIEYIDYSFPLKNLANLSQKAIYDIASNTATLCIDNNGYLKEAWNNPLNGNEDYLTRYEKSNHVDEFGLTNKYYGFDGLWHPAILTSDVNNAKQLFSGQNETEIGTIYQGLNLSKKEIQKYYSLLNAFSSVINTYINNGSINIMRYGHDIYGNSYILVRNGTQQAGTLWFRPKNHPLAFPALVFNNSGIYDQTLSMIDLTYENANQYFKQIKRQAVVTGSSYQTPLFADFTFSTDKTTLLLNAFNASTTTLSYGNSFPVIANVVQEYKIDQGQQYFVRTFAKDKTDKSLEHFDIPAGMTTVAYYYEGRHIGQIFAKLSGSETSTKLKITVQKYNHDNVNAQIKSAPCISKEFTISDINDSSTLNNIKFSCRSDGTISIAYISGATIPTQLSTYTGSKISTYSNLANTIDVFDKRIVTRDYTVYDTLETIQETSIDRYLPFVEMGFIRLSITDQDTYWKLSDTTFATEDFLQKKVLKFTFDKNFNQIVKPAVTVTNGIDFKYICPIRVEETENHQNSSTTLNVNSGHLNVAFQRSYGKGSLRENLKHYAITDMHVLDSMYNQYVLSGNIPEYLDLTEYEQSIYDTMGRTTADVFAEYSELVNYDVARYLSSLRDELDIEDGMTEEITYDNQTMLIDKMDLITEPFLVDSSQFYQLMDSSYINGYSGTTTNIYGDYKVSLSSNIDLSVSILKNDYGTIKIDFNPIYYFNPQANLKGANIRNKLHLFLNLDKPGDSGYLNIYEKDGSTTNIKESEERIVLNLIATLFIKNISTTVPKFILKAVYFDTDDLTDHVAQLWSIDADKEIHRFRNSKSQKNKDQTFVLVDESATRLPIEFG